MFLPRALLCYLILACAQCVSATRMLSLHSLLVFMVLFVFYCRNIRIFFPTMFSKFYMQKIQGKGGNMSDGKERLLSDDIADSEELVEVTSNDKFQS